MSIQESSIGDLQREKNGIDGLAASAAGAMNAGQKPDWTGGQAGESLVADVAMSAAGHSTVQAVSEISDNVSQSSFYQPTHAKKGKRPTDALGLPVTRAAMISGMRQESRMLAHVGKSGRMPVSKMQGEGVFQRAHGNVFGGGGGSKFVRPEQLQMKFLKWTPQMVERYLMSDELRRRRAIATALIAKPMTAQIDAGLAKNEASGMELLQAASEATQDKVIAKLTPAAQEHLMSNVQMEKKEDQRAAQNASVPKAPKPHNNMMAPKPPTMMSGQNTSSGSNS